MILARCRRQSSESGLVSSIINELNLVQETICERGVVKPWFLINITEVAIDATGFKAPIPEDLIDLFEEPPAVLLVSSSGALKPLERAGRADVEWSLRSPNTLSAFELNEAYILLATAQAAGTRLRILYYQKEPLPVGNYGDAAQSTPNRWYVYAPDVLINEVGAVISRAYLRDDKIALLFDAARDKAWLRLHSETVAKAESARERFMNGSLYPLPGPARTYTASGSVSDPVGFTTRTYNTSLVKGDTWTRTLTYTVDGAAVDLSTYTAELEVKASYSGPTLLSITQASGITLGADGSIVLVLSAAQTNTLAVGAYVYDLQLTSPGGTVGTILQGTMTVQPEVTT